MSQTFSKLDNFEKAYERLKEGIAKYDETNDLIRDGLIQRFEFTFELAWKTIKEVFEDEGVSGLNSPKRVLREAYLAEVITDDELWLSMLADKKSTNHFYSETAAIRICTDIKEKYVHCFGELIERIKERFTE